MKQELRISIDFTKYKGKYIALVDKKIVASGKNAKDVLENAKKKYPKKRGSFEKNT